MGALWQSDPQHRELASNVLPAVDDKPAPRPRRWRLVLYLLLASAEAAATALLFFELRSAHFQARELSRYAATLTYRVEPGPSPDILYPADGPFDKRQGYAYLPLMLERLQQRDFLISEQARFSPALMASIKRRMESSARSASS